MNKLQAVALRAAAGSHRFRREHGGKIARLFPAALTVFALSGYGSRFSTPMNMQWLGIAALASWLVLKAAWTACRNRRLPLDHLDAAVLLFLGYSAASLYWSEDVGTGIIFLAKATMLYAVFHVLRHYADAALLESLRWGILISVLVVVGREVGGGPAWGGFHNENFVTEYLLHGLPFVLLACMTGGRGLRWSLGALTLWLIHYFAVRNGSKIELAVFAGLVGLYGFLWLCSRPATPAGRSALAAGLVGLGCFAVYSFWTPFWASDFGGSFKDRTGMYVAAVSMIKAAPFFGVGAGGYRCLLPLHQEDQFQYFSHLSATNLTKLVVSEEAHSDYLEFLASFGLVGALFLIPIVYLCRRDWKPGRAGEAGLMVVAVAALNALVEFPLQNPATTLLLVLGLAHGTAGQVPEWSIALRARWARLAPAVVSLVLVALTASGAYRYYWYEVYDRMSRHYFSADGRTAFAYMDMAHRYNPLDWMGNLRLYEALVNWQENNFPPPPGLDVAERVYRTVSATGVRHVPLVVYGRIQILLNDGRYRTHGEEIRNLFDSLFRSSKRLADTWILYGYYNALMGNTMLARQSLDKAREVGRTFKLEPNQLISIGGVESLIERGPAPADPFYR